MKPKRQMKGQGGTGIAMNDNKPCDLCNLGLEEGTDYFEGTDLYIYRDYDGDYYLKNYDGKFILELKYCPKCGRKLFTAAV